MSTPKYELDNRINKLRQVMAEMGIDVFVSGGSAQIDSRGTPRYFLDYYVPVFEEYMLIPLNGLVTVFPHDYAGANYASTLPAIEEIIVAPTGVAPAKIVADTVKKYKVSKIGVANLTGLSYSFVEQLKTELSSYEIIDISDKITEIREVKSSFEIEQTLETVKINEDSFYELLKEVKSGSYDIDALNKARAATDLMGVEDQYWMVGTQGSAGFWIAAKENPVMWKEGDLIAGVTEHAGPGGHWGEVANLISIGEPEKIFVDAQQALANAQREAASIIKPGENLSKMVDIAQKSLEEQGFAEILTTNNPTRYFGHSQGIDVFEPPVIFSGSSKLMKEGMRLNFHPSATLPNGRKISYCVCYLVTKNGYKRLTNLSDKIYIV